jgi:glycosyltransferase involved in cell wall biosynthesis
VKFLRIAVPTFNSAATIGATLESLRPTLDFSEVVVVDSGSTDGTSQIVQAFGCEMRYEPPGNMYGAINTGLQDAATDWVTYINGDDLLYARMTRRRIERADPSCDLLYGAVDFIDEDGRFLRSWRPAREQSLGSLYRAGYSPMLQQGSLIRRELYSKLGGFSTQYRYVSDADFWIKAIGAGAHFCRESGCTSVAAFRLHTAQASQQHIIDMRREHEEMYRAHGSCLSKLSVMRPMLRWRLENMGSYVERWLRSVRLGIRPVFCRSYDLPA